MNILPLFLLILNSAFRIKNFNKKRLSAFGKYKHVEVNLHNHFPWNISFFRNLIPKKSKNKALHESKAKAGTKKGWAAQLYNINEFQKSTKNNVM